MDSTPKSNQSAENHFLQSLPKPTTGSSKGELKKAIEFLLEEIRGNQLSKIEKEILSLRSRFYILEKNWNEGIISQSEHSIGIAKIINNLLDFISLDTVDNFELETGLSISDLILNYNRGQIQLDLRFFNDGDKGVMINRLRFYVIDISLEYHKMWFEVEASQKYGLDISLLNEKHNNTELILSHFIPPSSVDRFQIDLIAKGETRRILLKSELQTNLGWLTMPTLFLTINGGN